ncbi:MAG: RloB family protein [Ewingella americana]|jgi:hypothetical protein|uniref:RloB family protein n=1 Tax=Ewingella americana TaxID=41202 RepID=UPI00242C4B0C|nr:RloB family protein [Ewingella americana]MCI1680037.1 RloB family protein [Ewingella americana]MCI1855032.1 RloB family protein [Ewingella americana]MCI1863509.1 RloB family protein [Ewingella americana]MCI2143379.1 RloB family protein [Ewingella americana]MCI2164536.1 RloB family protein [Ewingella americana]
MGSEDLHHKRKPKKASELSRGVKNLKPLEKILIVCEGSKTEPTYFQEMIHSLELNTASVFEVTGDCGPSPKTVVNYAKTKYKKQLAACAPYDRVYCVIDKDSHTDYQEALNMIKTSTPKGVFVAINSIPCFEYWLVLHFEYNTKSYANLPKNSSGNQMLRELRRFIPDYNKGCKGVYEKLKDRLDDAIRNSKKSLESAKSADTDNPSSYIHTLIEKIIEIKSIVDKRRK